MANKVGLTDAKIAGLKAPTAGQVELADGIVPDSWPCLKGGAWGAGGAARRGDRRLALCRLLSAAAAQATLQAWRGAGRGGGDG